MNENERAAFLRYLRTGKAEKRAMAENGLVISQDMGGNIMARINQQWPLARLSSYEAIDRQKAVIPIAESEAGCNWILEKGAYTQYDPGFKGKEFFPSKIGGMASVSEELLEDSFYDVEAFLVESFARSLGLALETAFISGDGNGKPAGILQDADAVPLSGAELSSQDFKALFDALPIELLNSSSWLLSREAFSSLLRMSDSEAGKIYSTDASGGSIGQIFGRPAFITLLPPEKPVIFGDLSFYQIIDHGPGVLTRYDEISADHGMVSFRLMKRVDAKLLKNDAVKALEA